VRAIGGGLLIGLPLLFTQEMWQHGSELPWWKLLVLLGVAFVIVVGYVAISGFRRERNLAERLVDSVETMGIAIVAAFVALLVLGRVTLDTSLRDTAGQVALEAIPVAFGVSVARTQLSGGSDDDDRGGDAERRGAGPFGRLVVAAGGALLFALNVAPTEEVVLLATDMPPLLRLVTMAMTFLFTLAVVFYAEFGGRGHGSRTPDGPLTSPVGETLAAYTVSLFVSFGLLWAFGRTEGASAEAVAGQVIVLGVVASFGAAAGRLLLTSGQGERQAA
jgi:putative integral membrane protein (TIGR02587 family)